MGETKKIVVEGFPVERRPAAVRQGIEDGQLVRVTVESEPQTLQAEDLVPPTVPLHKRRGFAKGLYARHGVDPTDFVRQQDEWD